MTSKFCKRMRGSFFLLDIGFVIRSYFKNKPQNSIKSIYSELS